MNHKTNNPIAKIFVFSFLIFFSLGIIYAGGLFITGLYVGDLATAQSFIRSYSLLHKGAIVLFTAALEGVCAAILTGVYKLYKELK